MKSKKNIAHSYFKFAPGYNSRFEKLPIFVKFKLQFHEETLSWQRELGSLSSATSQSGDTLYPSAVPRLNRRE